MANSPFQKKIFIPLHAHTSKGSIGDSILKIKEYVKRAKEYGLTHLAATNHGSVADMYEFYDECTKENIQPIIGCEVYEVNDRNTKDKEDVSNHLVLIAKNETGLKNLLYITTDAQLNGFYYKPRTDISVMREHGEGIIALSGCLGGRIPKMIKALSGEISTEEAESILETIKAQIAQFKEVFDSFYLELQPGNFQEQIFANELLAYLSEETDTPLVITNDIHYLDAEDWYAHDIHVKISWKQKIEDPMVFEDKCYYFQNYSSISKSFSYFTKNVVEKAINNTIQIARSCSPLNLKNSNLNMPRFEVPEGHTEDSWLSHIAFERFEEVKNTLRDPAMYVTRLLYELDVLKELGYSGYFLVVRDFVRYARENGIPVGPGRGSVCGSLVAFLCDITQVDAVKYDLLFERFLSVYRKGSVPDVDLDFSADKRHLMFEYAVSKYGAERCALVSTFGMRKAKASLRDTARVFNIPEEIADEAAKLIPEVYYDEDGEKTTDLSIEDSLKIVPRLQEIAEEYPEWVDMAMTLEDLPRNTSIHAAGTLVSPIDLIDYVPLIKPNAEGINATALNLSDAEKAGFIKFDFLSLATLAVIDQTQHDVGFTFDFINHDYNDEEVWDLIGSKHTTCLFQIASKTYKDRMPRLRPRTIKQLAACLALVRGPCISSKADQVYMEIIEGKRAVELIHPFYDKATATTNGVLLYQEQLMNIAVNFGFSLEDGFKLMKAVSKKKIEKILEFEEKFRELAEKRNVPQGAVDRIWKIIVDAGLYCFNESHAVAYALLCYQSAYLKCHYPLYYMKNALTNAYFRKEEIEDTVQECRRMGFRFAPLDVNDSDWEFKLEDDNSIRVGMCSVKSFGEGSAIEVISKRPFISFDDFIERVEKSKCSKRTIVPAVFSGFFSCFNPDRRAVYEYFCEIRKDKSEEEIKLQGGQTFNIGDPYDTIEELLMGAPLISTAVNNFKPIGFDQIKNGARFTIDAVIRRVKAHKDKSGKNMAFLSLETADGHLDCIVFSDIYKAYKAFCKKGLQCKVIGKKDSDDSCVAIKFE